MGILPGAGVEEPPPNPPPPPDDDPNDYEPKVDPTTGRRIPKDAQQGPLWIDVPEAQGPGGGGQVRPRQPQWGSPEGGQNQPPNYPDIKNVDPNDVPWPPDWRLPPGYGGKEPPEGSQNYRNDPLFRYVMGLRQGVPMGMGQGQVPTPPPPGPAAAGMPPGGGGQPTGGAGPQGWQPPVPPGQVAGIGHRFGQEMNSGEPTHSGVDLQAPEGSQTISPVDGMVERVENNPQGLGLTVIIRDKQGMEHRLGHLSSTQVYPGMKVAQGQDLAKVGSTGNTTGAHLHWGVKDPQGAPVDPTKALGPMQNMPPVPGTQMMGPPGGNGGQAQQGAQPQQPGQQMGGGQDRTVPNPPSFDHNWTGVNGQPPSYEMARCTTCGIPAALHPGRLPRWDIWGGNWNTPPGNPHGY
jgi:hypothetical protein